MAEPQGVLIYGEINDGKLASITTEILGCGRKLAEELKEGLSCILLGSKLGEAPQDAITYGADKVYTVEDPLLADYQTDSYVAVMEKAI